MNKRPNLDQGRARSPSDSLTGRCPAPEGLQRVSELKTDPDTAELPRPEDEAPTSYSTAPMDWRSRWILIGVFCKTARLTITSSHSRALPGLLVPRRGNGEEAMERSP